MQEEDLRILVPDYRLGIRIKLRQRLKEWKERKVCQLIRKMLALKRSTVPCYLLGFQRHHKWISHGR